VISIQRTFREDYGGLDVQILGEADPSFSEFRKALDSRMKALTSDGKSINIKF